MTDRQREENRSKREKRRKIDRQREGELDNCAGRREKSERTCEAMGMESLRGPGCCNLLSVANTQQMCGAKHWETGMGAGLLGGLNGGHADCWVSQHACWEPVSSHITPCPQS